jgi:hypothetical protein
MVWRFTESWKEKSKSSRVFTWGKRAPFIRASPPWDSPRTMSLTSRLPVASTSAGSYLLGWYPQPPPPQLSEADNPAPEE